MIYLLKHHGQEIARGSDIACRYVLQRASKISIERALEEGIYTLEPWSGVNKIKTIKRPAQELIYNYLLQDWVKE